MRIFKRSQRIAHVELAATEYAAAEVIEVTLANPMPAYWVLQCAVLDIKIEKATKKECEFAFTRLLDLVPGCVAGLETATTLPRKATTVPVPGIMHVPQANFRGTEYPARSFVFNLDAICAALVEDREKFAELPGTVRFMPATSYTDRRSGKTSHKQAKYEISPEVLPDFWSLVNGLRGGEDMHVTDKTQGPGKRITVKIGG